MKETGSDNRNILRNYLLGKIDSERDLQEIETGLLTDEAYFEQLLLEEEQLLEDYIYNTEISGEEFLIIEKFINRSPERLAKMRLIKSLRELSGERDSMLNESLAERRGFLRTIKEILSIFDRIKNLKLEIIN